MGNWSRIVNIFRTDRLNRDFDEELRLHVAEAIAEGRDPSEARRSLGPALQHREASRDQRIVPWLDSLKADVIYGWRQIVKNRVTSAAAVLSLGLAIGSCTSAFRLIDAVLLRPLPVAGADRLLVFSREGIGPDGKKATHDGCSYPMFQAMRAAVKNDAELFAVSYAERVELTFGGARELERGYSQYVSGWMFPAFELKPAAGRLFTAADDQTPGGHPYAVLGYDFWTRRFGRDPQVVGRPFRVGNRTFEVIGVMEEKFTGTEPGIVVDVFLPAMMHPAAVRNDSTWHRTLVAMRESAATGPIEGKLHATAIAFERERLQAIKGFPPGRLAQFLNQQAVLLPAASGVSGLQERSRGALRTVGVLVALVLLIACANVANLMTARAASRAREMAMRVSIGAGRARLIQLVLAESAWIAFLAALIGACFAWWSAPVIAGMLNPASNPARLAMPADGRVFGFAVFLSAAVTLMFGLTPALRASGVKPASVLKGGDDPHARRHLMHSLVSLQVAFCVLVVLAGTLFIGSYDRLVHEDVGFSADGVLVVSAVSEPGQPVEMWRQVASQLRTLPGVDTVALSDRTFLEGWAWNGFINVNGSVPSQELAYFRMIAPGWLNTMRVPLLIGRDFDENDAYPRKAIVNETFVKTYLGGANPLGRTFGRGSDQLEIVGVVRDTRYRTVREAMLPQAFFPFRSVERAQDIRNSGTLVIRTSVINPMTIAEAVRREIAQARPGFRASNIRTQREINDSHTVRERLLAMLAVFFAAVALLLAGVGVYGVLEYSVLQRRREIGIRMALGAAAANVVRRVTAESLRAIVIGTAAGLAIGVLSERYVETLIYGVHLTDARVLTVSSLLIIGVALVAVAPAVIRAVRIDPARTLRAE
jgi:putative ABC transport system permease protein